MRMSVVLTYWLEIWQRRRVWATCRDILATYEANAVGDLPALLVLWALKVILDFGTM